jgi:prepilin-type N-terminal cleavage/methylation domain-containing protein/prepilin-type processing-associated H-X9-DG protein
MNLRPHGSLGRFAARRTESGPSGDRTPHAAQGRRRASAPRVTPHSPLATAFTLIELLVVIAIIAILAALLLPALGRAKSASKTIRCAANQKQWILATTMYLDEHRDTVPFFADGMSSTQVFWFQRLAPYLGQREEAGRKFDTTETYASEVRRCPGGNAGAPPFCPAPREDCARWNCYVGAHFGRGNNPQCPLSGPFYYGEFSAGPNAPLKSSAIGKPADALFYLDTTTHYVYSLADPAFRPSVDANGDGHADTCADAMAELSPFNAARPTVHNQGCNVTLLDGHVERLAFNTLWRVNARGQPLHSYWYLED